MLFKKAIEVQAAYGFTVEQLADFHTFEAANSPTKKHGHRVHGHTDPRSTGLTRERHRFVMLHYSALRDAAKK